jgi:ABC-type polysaccharide/polyol phosphate transport system ATPase subunit
MTGPSIACQGVWKTFRLPHDRPFTLKQRVLHPRSSRLASELHALRDVSFDVPEGEFIGIVGRNGSGKSTLLKCLAGIYPPDRGTIAVSGRVSPFIELGVGFNPELTARDNVVVNAALLGVSRGEALARFPAIIEFAELERFVDLKLKNYSSGMQVRLGFASMIQTEADLYLVDEVLAVGDSRFQQKCFDTFRRLKRDRRTVVFVTHDLATVERFCDRALLLEGGEVVVDGDTREVTHIYRQRDIETEQASTATGESSTRFGDGTARVVEVWFEDADGNHQAVLQQGQRATYRARVRFEGPMESPVFGVILKAESGAHVFVTNTMLDSIQTGDFAAGEEAVYSVTFDVYLADGYCTATPAVAHQDAQRFADWWEDGASIAVRGEYRSGGLVDLPHQSAVERASPDDGATALRRSAAPSS